MWIGVLGSQYPKSTEFLRSLEITYNIRPQKYLNYLTPNKGAFWNFFIH